MDKKNTTNIIILLSLVIVAIAYFFLLPRFATIQKLSFDIAVKDKEATALTQKVSALKELKMQFSAKAQLVSDLESALPPLAKADEIFIMLQSIATESGVIIENIQPAATAGSNAGQTASQNADVNITVSGDFQSIIKFSNGLSTNLRPIEIYSANIVAQDKEEDKARLSATFETGFLIARPQATQEATSQTKEGI